MSECVWTESIDGVWETICGNAFEVTNGTPTENEFQFCVYCGKPLREVREARDE